MNTALACFASDAQVIGHLADGELLHVTQQDHLAARQGGADVARRATLLNPWFGTRFRNSIQPRTNDPIRLRRS